MKPIEIAGVGSAIADYLYDGVDFDGPAFRAYRSRVPGDGGLEPGKLVLTEDFESFAGVSVEYAMSRIVGDRKPSSVNLGGPTAVALITAAQMLVGRHTRVRFYAANGNDEAGRKIRSILDRTPVDCSKLAEVDGAAPYTLVLSDPTYHGGSGERTFLNNIGSSRRMTPERLDAGFFEADIRLFGGTALVPPIHEALTALLERAAHPRRLSVVATVYDFPAEKRDPEHHWPLGESNESYRLLDLLIADSEEARRLSGKESIEEALEELARRGAGALIVTSGTDTVRIHARPPKFVPLDIAVPISSTNITERGDARWDTTGCGDNFAGAVLFSLASQLQSGATRLDLREACTWGVAAGDFACYYMGGTYIEDRPGEKFDRIASIRERYEASL